jgi:hypothetical protein
VSATGGGGFGFDTSRTAGGTPTSATGQSPNRALEATISRLLEMSYGQIEEWVAIQILDQDANAGADTDDDPDGFDPDEDSEADSESDPDELQDERSEWDSRDARQTILSRGADIVIRPGDPTAPWVAVLVRPAAPVGTHLPVLLRTALQSRDKTVLAVAQALVDWQRAYLSSLDLSDLRSLTQDTVAKLASLTKGRVSRTIGTNTLELPDGRVLPLEALIIDSDHTRARLIRDVFLENDRVVRVDGVAVAADAMMPWEAVYQAVRRRLDDQKGSKESNFRRAAKKFGLPVSVRARRRAYLEGTDWWTESF